VRYRNVSLLGLGYEDTTDLRDALAEARAGTS
jgi:hypothetical protein